MKPGDLIRLSSDYSERGVCIASIPTTEQWWVDSGTLAVFLGVHLAADHGLEAKYEILVDGRAGWIYESECEEVIDETR